MYASVKYTNVSTDTGVSPRRPTAIIWTNVGILLIGPLGTEFSEILIEIETFTGKKMHLDMTSAKWRPYCLGLNILIPGYQHDEDAENTMSTMHGSWHCLYVSSLCYRITVTSLWTWWRLKSPASGLFTQLFIQAQIKENINAPRHWPLCRNSPVTGEIPAERASNAENVLIWWRHHGTLILTYPAIIGDLTSIINYCTLLPLQYVCAQLSAILLVWHLSARAFFPGAPFTKIFQLW